MKQRIYTLYGSWMKRTIIASALIFSILCSASAQTQLVQWNFSNFSNTPTANLPQNAGKLVTAVGQNQAAFISAAGTLYDPPYIVNGWNQPGEAYFLMNFSTLGYMNNTITYYLGAFEFGAKSFQPQFSVVSDIGPWLDFGTAVTFPPAGGATMFTDVPLPALADNQPNVWVRMLSTTAPVGNGGDYIDEIAVMGTPLFPLSVNISAFTGRIENGQNILNWTTQTESNSSRFEIQRARKANDFVTIASVPTRAGDDGYSTTAIKYTYTDATPGSGRNYYRLQALDRDGNATYSKVIEIVNSTEDAAVSVYPNPFTDVLHIKVHCESEKGVTLILYDMYGNTVRRKFFEGATGVTGANLVMRDLATMMPGPYVLKVFCGNDLLQAVMLRKL